MKRRKFLAFGISSAFGVLSGCGAPGLVGGSESGSESETITVQNETDKRHKVMFTVSGENSDKKIIDETFTLNPGSKKEIRILRLGTIFDRHQTWFGLFSFLHVDWRQLCGCAASHSDTRG